ncbi:MAG: outer membrane beta-barrel protein [Flavobacteriales bacterium]
MKKSTLYCLFIILLAFVNQQTKAQSKEEQGRKVQRFSKTQFGIRSGLNLSFPTGNLIERLKSRVHYHLGAYAQIPSPSKQFLYEIGGYLSNEGFETALIYGDDLMEDLEVNSSGNQAPTNLKAQYLDIQYIVKDNQNNKYSAFAGLETTFLLNSEVFQEYKEDGEVKSTRVQNPKGLQTFGMGAIIGLEYHVNHFLHVNLNYTYPFTRMFKNSSTDVKNNSVKLGVGFTF